MTIAAGIRCSDGLVICADTEITEGNFKSDKPKIWNYGDCLIVTGSGTSDYIKMAFDKLSAILKLNLPDDPDSARDGVETLIYDIYQEHILPFSKAGHYLAMELSLSLIVGIRCKNAKLALIKTTLTGAALVENFECTGSGSDVFKYGAGYFLPAPMSMELAGYFCLFMIREAKKVISGVGGKTHVFKLATDVSKMKHRYTMWDDTEILAGFPQSTVKLIFACADERQDADFEPEVLDYIHRFRNLRQSLSRDLGQSRNETLAYTATASAAVKIVPFVEGS